MASFAIDQDTKAGLLGAFPFSSHELDCLLNLYSSYKEQENGNFTSLHQWLFGASNERDDLELMKRVQDDVLPPNLVHGIIKEALATVFVLGTNDNDDEPLQQTKTFLEAMATLVGRRGPKSIIQLLHQVAKDNVLTWVHRLSLASHVLYTGIFPESLEPSKLSTPSSWKFINGETFVHWATDVAPGACTALSTFFHVVLFTRHHAFRPDIPPLLLPQTDLPSALFTKCCGDDVCVSLALLSPNRLGGDWKRLYSNEDDGFSFRTMQEALLSFKGSTVILIQSTAGDIIGYRTDSPWKSSRKWFGKESDSFLFTLHPTLTFYPATGEGTHYQYLQLPTIRHPQDLRGLAVGGVAADRPRLHITESLEKCRACEFDVAYTPGPLMSDPMEAYFDVQVLEVWATNEDEASFVEAKKRGSLQVQIREATRTQVASVDRGQFVDDLSSGAYMNKAFNHRDHVGDRHSFSVRDLREELNLNDFRELEELDEALDEEEDDDK